MCHYSQRLHRWLALTAICVPLVWLAAISGREIFAQESSERYLAVLRDGTRLSGNIVLPWHFPGSHPRLADRLLFEPGNPLRWLRDTRVEEREPNAYIEFAGGDRLPGAVLQYRAAGSANGEQQAAAFVVRPEPSLDWATAARDTLLISTRWARRLVWEASSPPRPFQPQTAFLRDGRQLSFRSFQFLPGGVRLLLDQQVDDLEFFQLRELHLPAIPAWDSYVEQLAGLAPRPGDLIERIVTTDGLRATSTTERFLPRWHRSHDAQNWYHAIQPAWSFEPLYLRFVTICQRRYHLPHEVPWSYLDIETGNTPQSLDGGRDASSDHSPAMEGFLLAHASQWPARLDRSVFGGRLRSGGEEFNWGLAVHAPSQVRILLPRCATAVQTRLALDDSVGSRGGCARAFIRQGRHALFTSEFLIGAGKCIDSGLLPLRADLPRELWLEVDPCSGTRPKGADPLNIRDMVNWLEGVVILDERQLASEVARHAKSAVSAWDGWTIAPHGPNDPHPFELTNHWDQTTNPEHPAWRLVASSRVPFARLTRECEVLADRSTLEIAVSRFAESSSPGKLQIQVNGKSLANADIPPRYQGMTPLPIAISLAAFAGQQVTIELVSLPLGEQVKLDWRGISFVE